MRRRLYFVLPELSVAEVVEKELLVSKIDDHHIHYLAKDGASMGRLHVANLLQSTDLLHGMGVGFVVGGITGMLGGLMVTFYSELGATLGMGGILILAVLGAIVGSWASGMIAVSAPNTRLKQFQSAIDGGQILLMVDVPVRRVTEIRELILSHHPEAKSGGADNHVPAFP